MVIVAGVLVSVIGRVQAADPPIDNQRHVLEQSISELTKLGETFPDRGVPEWADAAIFAKGLTWALKYERALKPSDIALLETAVRRGKERYASLAEAKRSWMSRRGRVAVGYVSAVDGSVQPYGVVIPRHYDPNSAIRLDVILHGSMVPTGFNELRFISQFDEGDDENPSPPDQPYIELHPLGRVENGYRWSGETDVWEAIADVCRRYRIDRDRIVLRGMSMGASGTWHLGLKHPDRFAALGPYSGYVDTHRFSETQLPSFVRVGQLPEYQERGLHLLDSIDYAANAGTVPAIACMGEKDIFFQAHVLMGEAMQHEGLTMVNLIAPGTGHVIDPVAHAEQMRRIAEIVAAGRQPHQDLRFVTWSLKYNRCHWLELLGLDQHYVRAEISARTVQDTLIIDEPRNITRFAIVESKLPMRAKSLRVGSSELKFPEESNGRIVISRQNENWQIEDRTIPITHALKRPGLQGPIDDAFTSAFVCIRGTGKPWNASVQTYSDSQLQRFANEWHHYFRGELPIKDDVDVTDADLQTRNLILFGDPGSNLLIARALPHLPLTWTPQSMLMNGEIFTSTDHVPILIAPNPLSESTDRYVVLNSGHTFHEQELSTLNYLLFPRWGDWAVLRVDPAHQESKPSVDHVLHAGFFNERWQFPNQVNPLR